MTEIKEEEERDPKSHDFDLHFSEIYQLDVEYQVISSNLLASAFTYHELEKVASTFELHVGDLLLLEATNLNDAVLVGSKRTLYFSTETSKPIAKPIYYSIPSYYMFETHQIVSNMRRKSQIVSSVIRNRKLLNLKFPNVSQYF